MKGVARVSGMFSATMQRRKGTTQSHELTQTMISESFQVSYSEKRNREELNMTLPYYNKSTWNYSLLNHFLTNK